MDRSTGLTRVILWGSDGMAAALAILKWIGIVAGGILGLALLLGILVVCVPVRYYLSGNNRDVLCYQYRLSWLLHAVSVRKKMESDEVCLRILGIPVFRFAGGGSAGTEKKDKKPGQGKQEKQEKQKEQKEQEKQEEAGQQEMTASQTPSPAGRSEGMQKTSLPSEKKSFSFDLLSGIINFVRDTGNRSAFRRVWKELRSLVCYLAPQRIRGHLVIGTGDPSSTGLMIGGISLLPFVYQDGLDITPDFDEKIFQADGMIKGRVRILYLLRLCIRLYRDKELKKLWDNIQNLKKEAA